MTKQLTPIKTTLTQSNCIDATDSTVLIFDGSFEGWLTAVFIAYELKLSDKAHIYAAHDYVPNLYSTPIEVVTDSIKAARVFTKIKQILPAQMIIWAFLSELPDIYQVLFHVVNKQLASPISILGHYTDDDVRTLHETVKKVGRERHRMQAFVRFEATTDGVYFAKINPDFNVLPLLGKFFAKRFADQSWLIFDVLRGYGIYYDSDNPKAQVQIISEVDSEVLKDSRSLHTDKEPLFQRLWQVYFRHVTISERKNMRHHIQQMPRRYWQYLTEKQG